MSTMSFITSIYQNKNVIYQTNDTGAEALIQKSEFENRDKTQYPEL